MPHFWMSCIAVEDALATAELAKEFDDAKVELTDEFYGGNIALIRDPQGAGFTVYDGGKLNTRKLATGHLIWNELHVSKTNTVVPFYERLFGWTVEPTSNIGKYNIFDSNGEHISDISNELKGKTAKGLVKQHGGGVVFDEGQRIMMHDNSQEAFFYIQRIS